MRTALAMIAVFALGNAIGWIELEQVDNRYYAQHPVVQWERLIVHDQIPSDVENQWLRYGIFGCATGDTYITKDGHIYRCVDSREGWKMQSDER